MGKKIIFFGADMSSSVHINNKNKDILILGEGPTQGLDDNTLTAGLFGHSDYGPNYLELKQQDAHKLQTRLKDLSLNLRIYRPEFKGWQ